MGDALVAGGGLGGLSFAIGLGKAGFRVRLLEQAAQIEPIGYGIQIGPNAFPVFKKLGVDKAILEKSHLPSSIQMLDSKTGEMLGIIPLKEAFERRFKNPYICIHRVDIHEILLAACRELPNVELIKNVQVTGFAQDGARVQVHTSSGEDYEGDFLIGADGVRSKVRAQLHPEDELQPIGYVAHRTIAPARAVPDLVCLDDVKMWVGRGYHVIYYPLRDKTVLNMVAVFRISEGEDAEGHDARKAQLVERCKNDHPEMRAVLDLMNFEQRWVLADRKPIRRWSSGRVVLLGDAAHATLQSLAQGAGMAIEGAGALAQHLIDADGDIEGAFKQYQADRLTRSARVQLESRALWEMYHAGGIAADVRHQQYVTRTPDDFYKCLDWLWAPAAG